MSFVIVYSLVQLLLVTMMMLGRAATAEGRPLDVEHVGTMSGDAGGAESRPETGDLAERSEPSRRRWYGSDLMTWNNHDMPWLKRGGGGLTSRGVKTSVMDSVDKRGWGNGMVFVPSCI